MKRNLLGIVFTVLFVGLLLYVLVAKWNALLLGIAAFVIIMLLITFVGRIYYTLKNLFTGEKEGKNGSNR